MGGQIDDRRLFPRFPAADLMANIGGKLVEVEDISLGGLRVHAVMDIAQPPVTLTLYPRVGDKLLLNEGVTASGVWVGCYGQSMGLRFVRTTMPLSKLVLRQAAKLLGVEPYLLK